MIQPNVYLAGPLFSRNERQWNVSLRNTLETICDVYLPQEDGALLVDLVANGMPVSRAKNAIFERDLQAIGRATFCYL
jgi:nucleoside 2-deoxyribosyltransferase